MISETVSYQYVRLLRSLSRLCLIIWLASGICLAENFVIFTSNPDIPSISKSKAKMIFIGKTKSIKSLGKVTLMDWPLSSLERKDFYQKLLHKSPAQVNSKWASLAFSGKAKPPIEMISVDKASLKDWIDKNPKGLAYAPISQVPEGANILLTIQ